MARGRMRRSRTAISMTLVNKVESEAPGELVHRGFVRH